MNRPALDPWKASMARQLRGWGWSWGKIARALDVTRSVARKLSQEARH